MTEDSPRQDTLFRLQRWYASHCDGDWEHTYGVQIDTLDNPGWSLKIDLYGTELENVSFDRLLVGISEEAALQGGDGDVSWYVCEVINAQFVAIGGPRNLGDIIEVFLEWAEENSNSSRQ